MNDALFSAIVAACPPAPCLAKRERAWPGMRAQRRTMSLEPLPSPNEIQPGPPFLRASARTREHRCLRPCSASLDEAVLPIMDCDDLPGARRRRSTVRRHPPPPIGQACHPARSPFGRPSRPPPPHPALSLPTLPVTAADGLPVALVRPRHPCKPSARPRPTSSCCNRSGTPPPPTLEPPRRRRPAAASRARRSRSSQTATAARPTSRTPTTASTSARRCPSQLASPGRAPPAPLRPRPPRPPPAPALPPLLLPPPPPRAAACRSQARPPPTGGGRRRRPSCSSRTDLSPGPVGLGPRRPCLSAGARGRATTTTTTRSGSRARRVLATAGRASLWLVLPPVSRPCLLAPTAALSCAC